MHSGIGIPIKKFVFVFNAEGPCVSFPCKNGGTCYGYSDDYYCQCPQGFRGEMCQSSKP